MNIETINAVRHCKKLLGGAGLSAKLLPKSRTTALNAIKEVRRYLEKNPGSPSAEVLSRLTAAIAEESQFALGELYERTKAFELGIELMKDWRLDRYYAARIRLFDVVLHGEPARSTASAR